MTKKEIIDDKLKRFAKLLMSHDYLYSYSDDHRAWKAGVAEEKILMDMIEEFELIDEKLGKIASLLYKEFYQSKVPIETQLSGELT